MHRTPCEDEGRWCFYKPRLKRRQGTPNTASKMPEVQGEAWGRPFSNSPRKEPTLQTPCSRTAGLQSCESLTLCCLSHQFVARCDNSASWLIYSTFTQGLLRGREAAWTWFPAVPTSGARLPALRGWMGSGEDVSPGSLNIPFHWPRPGEGGKSTEAQASCWSVAKKRVVVHRS